MEASSVYYTLVHLEKKPFQCNFCSLWIYTVHVCSGGSHSNYPLPSVPVQLQHICSVYVVVPFDLSCSTFALPWRPVLVYAVEWVNIFGSSHVCLLCWNVISVISQDKLLIFYTFCYVVCAMSFSTMLIDLRAMSAKSMHIRWWFKAAYIVKTPVVYGHTI